MAVVLLIVLGLAVGKGSTPLDDWFHALRWSHPPLRRLLLFTNPVLVGLLWVVVLASVLLRRRWRLSVVVAVTPPIAVGVARLAKQLFGRLDDGALAYPSGHTTFAVVVLGMAVLASGAVTWVVVAAVVAAMLAALGQGLTYHYFTDAIGAVFLGTALVCLAAWAAGLDRCQPDSDVDHSDG